MAESLKKKESHLESLRRNQYMIFVTISIGSVIVFNILNFFILHYDWQTQVMVILMLMPVLMILTIREFI